MILLSSVYGLGEVDLAAELQCNKIVKSDVKLPLKSWFQQISKIRDTKEFHLFLIKTNSEDKKSVEFKLGDTFHKHLGVDLSSDTVLTFVQRYGEWHLSQLYTEPGTGTSSCWKFLEGGGAIFNPDFQVDQVLTGSGSDTVFVYPDEITALVGSFSGGSLVAGREAEITEISCDSQGVPIVIFRLNNNPVVFTKDISTKSSISSNPFIQDPMEVKYVEVKASSIPGAGEGLFLKQDVRKGDTVVFFNGVRITVDDTVHEEVHRNSVHKIWNDWRDEDNMLDIPHKYRNTSEYRATLGHKINSSKNPNVNYDYFLHPRFGEIRSVYMLRDGKKGDELTSKYGKVMDNLTFLKKMYSDFTTYLNLDDLERLNFLDNMKSDYRLMVQDLWFNEKSL